MGNRVQRVKTYVSEEEMRKAISEGWKQLFGTDATEEQVNMIMTQNALETNHRQSMWNYNLGNITTGGGHDYFDDLTTKEQTSPGVWEKKNLKYVAYPTLKDGVLGFLKFLSNNKRYAAAWQHILTPNVTEYSKALKHGGYYTADESKYTSGLNKIYKQYSHHYQPGQTWQGTSGTPTTTPILPSKEKSPATNTWQSGSSTNVMRSNMPQQNTESNLFSQLLEPSNMPEGIESLLEGFLQQVRASEKPNKRLYRKLLPHQHIIIQAYSRDPIDAIEFSRILCAALDEELLARAYTYFDGKHIEVECDICGPERECFSAVSEITEAVADAFKQATKKIGKVDIKTNLIMNKKSSYQELTNKMAEISYRKFLFKFA